jgi:hypothetical protein
MHRHRHRHWIDVAYWMLYESYQIEALHIQVAVRSE